jgi:hypothetical protein
MVGMSTELIAPCGMNCALCSGWTAGCAKHHRPGVIDNLRYIRNKGIEQFLEAEKERWQCLHCGGIFCVQIGICASCGAKRQ